ncbi:DUF1643 domain-containing protein [Pulveribacter sp.]|uniref:DUF1643 domain-containing protein n=1 Tax=Pulveribacter sp. TaxID=2678893 RepID=UPI0028B16D8E|nr:DUF1643 domain-containing protein [Pulveribacter sp.]
MSNVRPLMKTRAELSPCNSYRYALWREWSEEPPVLFVMLNPSTADASQDDPTIRRCISFAQQWGHGGLIVANLFAWRSPYPTHLRSAKDPIGPSNDEWLKKLAKQSSVVVGAWGNHGTYMQRGKAVASLFPGLQCLGLTKQGQPRHPLYVSASTQPKPMQATDV